MTEFFHYIMKYFALTASAQYFLPRIAVSLVCGTIIGLERELFNKTAGMKTLMLVCLGSTLFATLSMWLGQDKNVDQTRIIAQIVSGIGFLGAGVILQHKGGVMGMTSAANIWFTGAVGCVIGIGEYELAIVLSLISIFFLITYRWLENVLNRNYEDSMPHFYNLKIDCDPSAEIFVDLQKIIKSNNGAIKSSNLKKNNGTSKKIDIKYSCQPKHQELLLQNINLLKGIINLDLSESNKES